CARNDYAMDYW
nr:immunoglobulin heavy chain junction region [Mus musculus]MBK4195117.1 immunoglobulin heavy chain junction region [Mus musculus]